MSDKAVDPFEQLKTALNEATTLTHMSTAPDARFSIATDASQEAVGAVLQQEVSGALKPLLFFSRRLQPSQTRYSTLRELLAIYYAIRHFCHLLEGRDFTTWTDHKPLTFALSSSSERYSPRQTRHLDYISQFTSDILFLSEECNTAADAFFRMQIASIRSSNTNLKSLAAAQQSDTVLRNYRATTSLRVRPVSVPNSNLPLLYDFSMNQPRPMVPQALRRSIFEQLRGLSHPGIRATRKLITDRVVGPNMHVEIQHWTKACIQCQRSKL